MKILKRKLTTFLIILLVVATVGASVAIPAILNADDPPVSSSNNFGEYEGDSLGFGLYATHPIVHTYDYTNNYFNLNRFNLSSYPMSKYAISFDGVNKYGHITQSGETENSSSLVKRTFSDKNIELLPIPEELIPDSAVGTYEHFVVEFDMRIVEAGFVDDIDPYFLKISYGSGEGAGNDFDRLLFYKSSSQTYHITDRYGSIAKSNMRFGTWYNIRIERFSYAEEVVEGFTEGALYINNEYICDLDSGGANLLEMTFSIVPRMSCDNLVVDIDNIFAGLN